MSGNRRPGRTAQSTYKDTEDTKKNARECRWSTIRDRAGCRGAARVSRTRRDRASARGLPTRFPYESRYSNQAIKNTPGDPFGSPGDYFCCIREALVPLTERSGSHQPAGLCPARRTKASVGPEGRTERSSSHQPAGLCPARRTKASVGPEGRTERSGSHQPAGLCPARRTKASVGPEGRTERSNQSRSAQIT